MTAVIEIVRFRLRDGVTDTDFLAAADRFSREVSPTVPGLERRELLATGDHSYTLRARFTSQEHLEAAPSAIGSHPAARAFSACIDFDTFHMESHPIVQSVELTTNAADPVGLGPLILAADEGTSYDWSRDHVVVKTPLELTGGRVTLVEDTLKPGFHLPRHRHRHMVEIFHILEGEAVFEFEDGTTPATAGMTISIPKDVWHEVSTVNGARLLTIFTPGGFDHYLAELAALSEQDIQSEAIVKALKEKYDL
jgi:quercetin dioxygenase-like cupin family protein